MVTVTENAKSALKTALDNLETQPGQCVRIRTTSSGQFGLALDKEAQGDQVVTHDRSKVLLVDSETAGQLSDLILDYRDSGSGPEFTLLRKQETEETER
jgi:Fe-S cluster assembly iron-binding protein IscA